MKAPMIKTYRDIVLVDLEYTCWEKGQRPPDQRNEVLQIGYTKLSIRSGERFDRSSFLVRPQFSEVSEYCTNLTGITPLMAKKQGRPLKEVCARVSGLGVKSLPWGSFGDDRTPLLSDCEAVGALFPFSKTHFNFGALAQICFGVGSALVGQTKVMEIYGLTPEGRAHDAEWDSWNLAAIIPFLIKPNFIDVEAM
jgi:inhibitor of KinA sporulation pathway (predicted exonuclease)